MRKIISQARFFLLPLAVFPLGVSAQMMRRWYNGPVPTNGYRMMWGYNGQLGTWGWVFVVYHVVLALLFLIILVLLTMLLWKKLQAIDHEEKKKKIITAFSAILQFHKLFLIFLMQY